MIRLLMDENLASLYREQLLRHEPSLIIRQIGAPGAPPRGTLDTDLLLWCEAQDYVLVTNNRRSMPRHLAEHLVAGGHVPGILAIRRRAQIGQVLEHLLVIIGASFDDEYRDRIVYVPLG